MTDIVAPADASAVPEYGGFWIRLVAWLIDAVVMFGSVLVLSFAAGMVLGIVYGFLGVPLAEAEGVTESEQIIALINALMNSLAIVLYWVYYATFESGPWQATLGKYLLHLKVTDLDGYPISFGRATARHFSKFLSLLFVGLGFLMIGFTEKKQGLHDHIAKCLVIRTH